MLGENPGTTNDQLVPPLFLKKDDNQGRSEKGGSVSPRRPYGFRYGEAQEDSSSEEDIQKQKPLESIVATFQPRNNTGFRRFYFLERPPIVTIDSETIHMSVNQNLPRAVAVRWEGSEAFQSYFWTTEPSTTDAGQAHTDLSAKRRSHIRQILEQSAIVNEWGVGEAFQPRSSGAESPSVTADIGRTDKNAIWAEILDRLDVITQREDNWDGYESKKPNRLSLDNARRFARDFFDAIASEEHSRLTPLASSDEDGHITVEWHGEGRQLHLQIEEDEIDYIQVWGPNIDTEMHVDTLHSKDYLRLWKWLLYG